MLTRRNLTLVILFFIIWIVLTLVLPTLQASASPLAIGGLVVTRLDDPAPNGCQVGDCSLREAVMAANALTDSDTITFATQGTVELSIAGADEDNAQTGDLDITAPVTIEGIHPMLTTIDANGLDRVFHVLPINFIIPNHVTVTNMTVIGGTSGNDGGGGIFIFPWANLTLENVTIRNNTSRNGGGIAIANDGVLTMSQSAILQNVATEGGGIYSLGPMTISNSTISSNQVTGAGQVGGIVHYQNTSGLINLNLDSVTIMANDGAGIGAWAIKGGVERTYLRNTIVANNEGGSECVVSSMSSGSAEILSSGYNIATDSSCNLNNTADLPNTEPRLGDLFFNAHYPDPDSPALDSGDTGLTVDQLGVVRPYDLPEYPNTTDGDDRGAVEFDTPIFRVTRLDDPAPNGCQAGDCSLREALSAADVPGGATVSFAVTGTVEIAGGVLLIHGSTILMGNGPENTIIDANGLSGVLEVRESSNNPAPWCMPTIRDVTIMGGIASGLAVEGDCTFSLYDSVVRNNSSPNRGGGISYFGPAVLVATIGNSAIISNTAPNGGGIFMGNTFLQISNSTISGNSATGTGCGLYFASATSGSLSVGLNSVTIANNSAATGDAIAFEESAPPQNTTFALSNSVLVGSSGSACATIGFDTLTFTSQGYNLADDQSCNLTHSTDLPNTNPYLPALIGDGGTYVHVPALNSPALDSGSAGGLPTDQRGLPRPVDLPGFPNTNDSADRGAYEHQSLPPTAIQLTGLEVHSSALPDFAVMLLAIALLGITLWRVVRVLSL